MRKLSKEINSVLKSIDISRLFAQNLEHGVSYRESEWTLFEPTKFVYSFFAFNMLYEIDWNETLKRGSIWDTRGKYTRDKIILFLNFIHKHYPQKSFEEYYRKFDSKFTILENARLIKPDPNIQKADNNDLLQKKNSYLNNFRTALIKLKNNEIDMKEHYKLLIFCYKIRNNVFHGLKKATEMRKSGQRKRLLDYSYIILSTIEMFFDIMAKDYDYRPANDDELKENAGFLTF